MQTGTIASSAIVEASGMAASARTPGVLWVHNDSGDTARVFAVSPAGTLLGTYNITGALALDWEDIAVGPGPSAGTSYLYLADIGDNNAIRPAVTVYRVPEPSVNLGGPATTINLAGAAAITIAYPDGSHNAESLMIDPLNGDMYIATKELNAVARFYRAAAPLATSGTVTMSFLTTIADLRATAGSISPDGTSMIVRSLTTAFEWTRTPGETFAAALLNAHQTIALTSETQGEAIEYGSYLGTNGFFTTSEGGSQPIYFYAAVPEPGAVCLIAASLPFLLRRRTNN